MPAQALARELIPRRLVYGGSFDPPHTGHVECVRLAQAKLPKADVIIVPAFAPPDADKPAGALKAVTLGFAERVKLCEIAFASLGKVKISKIEADLPSPSFTVQTLTALNEGPAAAKAGRLGLLIGEDQLHSFLRWREPKAIIEMATLVVIPRPSGDGNVDSAVEMLQKELGCPVPLIKLDRAASPAASHLIRQRLDKGAPVPPGWLLPAVASSIKENAWYNARAASLGGPEGDLDDDAD